MHWHQQAEWAIMLDGRCRITVLDELGRPSVQDVKTGDLWYFPPGLPHSLQGLGTDGAEFLLAFDNGRASEFNTLLLTDWVAHTPPDVLALNFGVPADAFKNIPLDNLGSSRATNRLLAEAQRASASSAGAPPHPFIFSLGDMKPVRKTRGGEVRIADSTNFNVSTTVAAALVTVHPGGMRELHWHPNADEWQYYLQGDARMTVFDTGPKAQTADFRAGDVGYVKKSLGTTCRTPAAPTGVPRDLQDRPLCGSVAVRLARAYAAAARRSAPERRAGRDRAVSAQPSRRRAAVTPPPRPAGGMPATAPELQESFLIRTEPHHDSRHEQTCRRLRAA